MFFTSWLRFLKSAFQRRARAPICRRAPRPRGTPRLWLERLEDRTLPSSVTWINAAGGDWDTPGNWFDNVALTNHVPGAADDAVISLAGITVTHSASNSDTVNSLTMASNLGDTLALSAGTLSLTSTSAVNNNALNVLGGTLTGAGSLSVGGLFAWTGGTLGGTGSLTANGGINLSGNISLDTRTLTNAATATWTGTQPLSVSNGAVINNLAGATFDAQSDAVLSWTGAGAVPTFNNAGLFKKSAGTGATQIGILFNNSGTINVLSGGLSLQAGGTSGGSFMVPAGTYLQLGSTHALGSSSSVTGAGEVDFGGNITVGGTYNITGATTVAYDLGSPLVDFAGTVASVGASLTVRGAVASFHGNAISTTNFTLGGYGGSSMFTSTASLTVTGTLDWVDNATLGGSGAVNIPAGAVLHMRAPDAGPIFKYLDGRTLNNAGTASLFVGGGSGGSNVDYNSLVLRNGAVINNSGTFDVLEDRSLEYDSIGAQPVFNNSGTFRKPSGIYSSSVAATFNNSGTVNAQSGTLQFSNFQQTAGSTILSGGSLASGSPIIINGGTVTGSGIVYANVTSTGQVSPGSQLGLLNIQGNYTQTAPGDLHILLGGLTPVTQYDQLEVANSITLGGTLYVALVTGYMPHVNDTFAILKNDSGGAVAGTFAGLAEGAAFIAGGYQFRISYIGGAGHDVTLTVIKSPTSTSVISSANPSVYGQAVTFTATVNPPTGASTPSGTITFTIDGTPQAPVMLSGGQAIFATAAFAPLSHAITAAYSGDNLFLASNSLVFSQTVNPAPLTATGKTLTPIAGAPFNGVVASFTNADPFGGPGSYTAQITWGDGHISAGAIADTGGGTFTVSGANTFATAGNFTVHVQISHNLGYTTTAMTTGTAYVTNEGFGQTQDIDYWHNAEKGQALINSFNGGPTATALSAWLSSTFPNLYGATAGTNNLTGKTNAQMAAYFQAL
jgi:fibronectin-binding autotransporter adhesin